MIVVTGATGTIGRELISELTQAGHAARAVVRRAEQAEELQVEAVVGDFTARDDPCCAEHR